LLIAEFSGDVYKGGLSVGVDSLKLVSFFFQSRQENNLVTQEFDFGFAV